jgi:hypothetical protein
VDMFHVIEDATAIIRMKKGVFRQVKMYHRKDRLFVGYGSGFIRVTSKFGEAWGTSHPDISVIDFDCVHADGSSEPRYVPLPAPVPRLVKTA